MISWLLRMPGLRQYMQNSWCVLVDVVVELVVELLVELLVDVLRSGCCSG